LSEGLLITLLIVVVNLPMNFIGVIAGYKMKKMKTPTKISRVPRDLPEGLPWFLNFNLMSVISGVVPVFVIAFEIYQIMGCIRGSSYIYLIYWSFYVGFIVFLIVVAEISIMQTYLLICYEEYRWWWRCWLLGASTGFFSMLFLVNYFLLGLKATQFTTVIVYAVFCAIFSLSLSLMSGSIALMASLVFNLRIF
jgi:transmembrane 9 superfamily protein 2/4